MYDGPERRKHKRVKKPYMVRFKKHDDAAGKWDMVAVLNIGAGGMLFYYNQDLGADSILDIKINVSSDSPDIECAGKVLRVEEMPLGMYLVAVNFVDIDETSQETVQKTLDELPEE